MKTQRKRLLCSQKKKKRSACDEFPPHVRRSPFTKNSFFLYFNFQGLPYDFKIFCLYQNKVIWMSMPNVSFQKSKKKKNKKQNDIWKRGSVFFLNCALVKNSWGGKKKKKKSLPFKAVVWCVVYLFCEAFQDCRAGADVNVQFFFIFSFAMHLWIHSAAFAELQLVKNRWKSRADRMCDM